jgi:hypothetical protein
VSGREPRPPEQQVEASGPGSVGIGTAGRVLLLSLVGPEWEERAERVQRWSGWNWPQFFLVLLLDAVALSLAPDGPVRQIAWVYAAMAIALVLSFCRVAGLFRPRDEGDARGRRTLPPLVSLGCVVLASLAIVGMNHYAEHGEAEVTGRTEITGAASAADGGRLTVTVENTPHRNHLRLSLVLTDAVPGAQSCVPATTYDAELAGSTDVRVEGVRSGETFSLPLGGVRGAVRVDVVLHTDPGCRLGTAVADAVLHD